MSNAPNLVAGDTNTIQDIFVHDNLSGETQRVSIPSPGGQGDGSYSPKLSADARYVAFSSTETRLVAGDTNGQPDVFVHDRQTGETRRVSVSSAGAQANSDSGWQTISADGRYVGFASHATNLVAGDTGGGQQAYMHDLQTGATRRVSVSEAGVAPNGSSYGLSLSADGRYAAFVSGASNLVEGDTNNALDVFVYDVAAGDTAP
jgi:Tol biopolymer transport system component